MRHEYLKLVPENITVTFTDIHFSKREGEYKLRRFVEKNSLLIWEIAREDGKIVADII
ncbi:MAG: hypothetical protein IJS69_06315 [Selenomonadaceae bacterium]|nr:hypothetical protein [Selenomonadaceae bacterium]